MNTEENIENLFLDDADCNTTDFLERLYPVVHLVSEPSEPEEMEFIDVGTCIKSETPDETPTSQAESQQIQVQQSEQNQQKSGFASVSGSVQPGLFYRNNLIILVLILFFFH